MAAACGAAAAAPQARLVRSIGLRHRVLRSQQPAQRRLVPLVPDPPRHLRRCELDQSRIGVRTACPFTRRSQQGAGVCLTLPGELGDRGRVRQVDPRGDGQVDRLPHQQLGAAPVGAPRAQARTRGQPAVRTRRLPTGQLGLLLEGSTPRDRLLTLLDLPRSPGPPSAGPLLLEGGLLAQAPLDLGAARGRVAVRHPAFHLGRDPRPQRAPRVDDVSAGRTVGAGIKADAVVAPQVRAGRTLEHASPEQPTDRFAYQGLATDLLQPVGEAGG